jgi:hypothetical protein
MSWWLINSIVFGCIAGVFLISKILLTVFIEDNKTSTLLAIAVSTLLLFISFKQQHWAGQYEILTCGAITLVLWFALFRKKA